MNARNKEQYVAAWRDHVAELWTLALAADLDDYDEAQRTISHLMRWVEAAADNQNFEE